MYDFYGWIFGRNKNCLLENVRILTDYVEDQKICFDKVREARGILIEYQQLQDDMESAEATDVENDSSYETTRALDESDSGKSSFRSRKKSMNLALANMEVDLTKCISSEEFAGVTVDTLRATGGVDGNRYFRSPMGYYLMVLWTIMFVLILVAMFCDYYIDTNNTSNSPILFVCKYLNPFIFGMLGANVYLMRITSTRLSGRTFNPARLPEHVNRLFLGSVSGGVTILFLEEQVIAGGPDEGVAMSAAALGFIAGYSIEFLYQILDRIINAILPSVKDHFSLELYNSKKRTLMIKKFERDIQAEKAKGDQADKSKLDTFEQIVAELKG